jgi:hypothetical protein
MRSRRMTEAPRRAPSAAVRGCLIAGAVLALASCSRDESPLQESGVPGHVSAGGSTSGEIIARAKEASAQGSGGPEGTPGIPQGSGGTTGGPNMGGSTKQQAVAGQPGQSPGTAPGDKQSAAKETAKAQAERQQQLLAAAMDRAAARWQERQGQAGPGDSAQAGDLDASKAAPVQQPPRSEKHGSVPASEDVKQPRQQAPDTSGASLPSDAYKHGQ